tara:strand:+ start:73 stop:303 length:231 start_codon:yes stop_codon:yes gene_type:complete
MDNKEININNWLYLPIDNDYSDINYIENRNDNYAFCDDFALKVLSTIKSEDFTIKNENKLRDDIIELIYKYSHERK